MVLGSEGDVHNNVFVGNGNGITTESVSVNIFQNSFQGSVGADVVLLPFVDADIPTSVHDNTFSTSKAQPITVFLNGPSGRRSTAAMSARPTTPSIAMTQSRSAAALATMSCSEA